MHDALLANFRSYWLGFHRLSGGDGITSYHSGVPLGMYNGVLRVVEGTTIDAAKRIFGETPWVWWAGPDSPPEIGDKLLAGGAQAGPTFSIMKLELGKRAPVAVPARLAIGHVKGDTALASWVAGFAPNFGVPAGQVGALIELWRARPDLRDRLVRFEATDNGTVVGTAALHLTSPVAGVYNVTTAPAYRRRGVGSALVAAALAHAREQGLEVATLQARAAGLGVYERLGFTTVGEYRQFTFGNADGRRT